jgi:protein involved in polysaccharide export with SLBB domain
MRSVALTSSQRIVTVLALSAGLVIAGSLPIASARGLLGPDYQLSPGDVLQIDVFGDAEMSGLYTVGPAGTITIPQLGQIHLRGMTMEQAWQHLTERLGELLRLPHVVVSIREIESVRKVYVSGYVSSQAPLMLPFGATVVDAVLGAGITELSGLAHVRVTHPGEHPKVMDLSGIRTEQPIDITERVQYGDIIYVPKVQERIAVLGYVENPTTVRIPVGEQVRVLEAITRLAGGLSAGADNSTALLIHQDQRSETIDLHRLMREGDISENKVLQAGDVLVINEASSISIVGEVGTTASFRSGDPLRVLQLLANAQGFTPRADLAEARVYSKDGEMRPVDLEALWEEGDQSQNIQLFPGDILVIPEKEPETVLIAGAIEQPRVLDIGELKERDVLRIVTLSGPTEMADLRRVTVYREEKPIRVDVKAMMDEGQLSKNIDIEPGDIVMIPEKETLYVLGAVGVQGKFPWEPDLTALDVVARSGGLSESANTEEVHILRPDPEAEEWEHIVVSIGDYRKGIPPDEAILKPADIVYVPPKKPSKSLMDQLRDLMWIGTMARWFN